MSEQNPWSNQTDTCYRRISLGPDTRGGKPVKSLKLEHAAGGRSHDIDTLRQQQASHQRYSIASRRSSNASSQSLSAPEMHQWSNAVNEGAQLDTPGYVQPQSSLEQSQSSVLNDQISSSWANYDQCDPDLMQTMDSFRSEANFENNHNGTMYSGFPSIHVHGPDQDLYPSPGYSPFGHWNYDQQPRPDSTGYT